MSETTMPQHEQPPPRFCIFCGAEIPSTGNYCPRCGAMTGQASQLGMPPAGNRRFQYYARPAKKPDFRIVIKTISAFIMLIFIAQLALMLGTLLYGTGLVVPDILDSWSGFTLFVVVPVIVDLVTLSGYVLLAYYMFLVAAIVVSCVWVLLSSFRDFRNELTMKAKTREHSALFETVGLLFATIFFSVVIGLLANPSEDDLPTMETVSEMLFVLANASVWEEIAVRVLFIGVPLIFVDLVRKTRQNHWYSYVIGGKITIGRPEVALVLISSIVFGVGHFTGGWGAWKILPATVGGIAFGYLYLKFGIAASIMMHFSTDYLSMPAEVTDSMSLLILTGLGILIWLGAGAGFFVYYTTRVVEYLTGKRYFGPKQEVAPPQQWGYPPAHPNAPAQQYPMQAPPAGWQTPPDAAPPYQPPPVQSWFTDGYVCPACGYAQARWVNGRFQCMRCGRLS